MRLSPFIGVVAVLAAIHVTSAETIALEPPAHVTDLDGIAVDPLGPAAATRATVLLFTIPDCPISNRYAPELRRIHERFAARGVRFWLVYPNRLDRADAIRRHVDRHGYRFPAVRDPEHELVDIAGVTVAPEAAVFDAAGRRVYHGRIDDRYVSFGVDRPTPTRRDLEETLDALLAGRPIRAATTPAVGCYLSDLR